MTALLMPKATAVWLIDNTALTFDQIALFCGLHPLEVKGIANDDVAQGIKGMDPISKGQLTRDEIERCQQDATAQLQLAEPKRDIPDAKPNSGTRYTPLSKRQERPFAIAWLLRNHPEINDAEIGRLVGTTKPTIQSVRDRSHWNMSNVTPVDPVALGLCSQIQLDETVAKASRREERRQKRAAKEAGETGTLLKDADETTAIGADEGDNVSSDAPETPSTSAFEAEAKEKQKEKENDLSSFDELRPEDVFKN